MGGVRFDCGTGCPIHHQLERGAFPGGSRHFRMRARNPFLQLPSEPIHSGCRAELSAADCSYLELLDVQTGLGRQASLMSSSCGNRLNRCRLANSNSRYPGCPAQKKRLIVAHIAPANTRSTRNLPCLPDLSRLLERLPARGRPHACPRTGFEGTRGGFTACLGRPLFRPDHSVRQSSDRFGDRCEPQAGALRSRKTVGT